MESVLKSEFVRKKKDMLTFYNLMSDMLSEMTFTKKILKEIIYENITDTSAFFYKFIIKVKSRMSPSSLSDLDDNVDSYAFNIVKIF